MEAFCALYQALDASTATRDKLAAMSRYFRQAPPADAAWAVYLLAGGKPRQVVPTRLLRAWAADLAGLDTWLFEECYAAVGDLAETIAHVLPQRLAFETTRAAGGRTEPAEPPDAAAQAVPAAGASLGDWMALALAPLRGLPPEAQRKAVVAQWAGLSAEARFVHIKLIGGGFRVGVSRQLVQRALAQAFGLESATLAQRMMGYTDAGRSPVAEDFARLVAPPAADSADSGASLAPYPFFLAHALEAEPLNPAQPLGPVADWLAEWKYDGIRAQLVCRHGQAALWSRGEELISESFPEFSAWAAALGPDAAAVLDGEVLAWDTAAQQALPFASLQTRIGRTKPGPKLLKTTPVVFVAYDLLQWQGQDLRGHAQHIRRAHLEQALACVPPQAGLRASPLLPAADWPALAAWRAQARGQRVEGLMLKHREARYGIGRTRQGGIWWKWKLAPMTVDAVLIYAQAGHGRRAGLHTDYTFAVWNRPPADAAEVEAVLAAIRQRQPPAPGALQLVPFAKAYSGLTDAEFKRVDRWVREATVERFGPVRSVVPGLVFELGFEGLQPSRRHKSGVATRFPRMLRIRDDKPLIQANSLAELLACLPMQDPAAQA
jgi:DNA ligase-1